MMKVDDIAAAIKPDDPHFARTRLLCLENTWNGHVMPDAYLSQACEVARSKGLATHLDGARVFNAAVASASPGQSTFERLRQIADHFDSISVCFSKGLGAPMGSALCGTKELIERARRIRKMAGGGLRQTGLMAACALHALDHHVERLAQDHALAQRLAQGLQGIAGMSVRSAQTNIVFIDVQNGRGQALRDFLQQQGVLITGSIGLRLVTHLDVDEAGVDHAIAVVRQFFAGPPSAATSAT
jgi:threonine aldolase